MQLFVCPRAGDPCSNSYYEVFHVCWVWKCNICYCSCCDVLPIHGICIIDLNLFLAIVIAFTSILNRMLKDFFHRARPDFHRLVEIGGYSFRVDMP